MRIFFSSAIGSLVLGNATSNAFKSPAEIINPRTRANLRYASSEFSMNRSLTKPPLSETTRKTTPPPSSMLHAAKNLSPLPKGISPFEKSLSKNIDIQGEFRSRAKLAIDAALANSETLIEIEFPPLLGGSKSKSQFDDFDNIQELDKNKDWTMMLAPRFLGDKEFQNGRTWLVFPDLKECELAKSEWAGQRYQAATFTTIEAVTNFLGNTDISGYADSKGSGSVFYDSPWGSNLVSGLSKFLGGTDGDAGLLGDQSSLDPLIEGENFPAKLWLVIQPGNGGPVEDWVNCEKMHNFHPNTAMVIINGALDKVRGGFYPAIFFPKLAASADRFYKNFESVFYLKPITDKGVYGWLYRVYPEPWQVILEKVKMGKNEMPEVEYALISVLNERPTYEQVVGMLMAARNSE